MSAQDKGKEKIKAVILAGSRDFGRCALASQMPLALWPVMREPVLKGLLRNLAGQGIKRAVVCSNGDGRMMQSTVGKLEGIEVAFMDEPLPVGTGGCIRDAAGEGDSLLVVMRAAMISPPDIDYLLEAHREGGAAMTVFFKAGVGATGFVQCADMYVCERSVLDVVPVEGFCDIKEGLIPEMVRRGVGVKAAAIAEPLCDFRDRESYIKAVGEYMRRASDGNDVKVADSAKIASSARIFGPAAVLEGAVVSEGCVVLGPAVIGRNVLLGKDAVVEMSAIWDGACIGAGSRVSNSIIDRNVKVGCGAGIIDEAVVAQSGWMPAISESVRGAFVQLRGVRDFLHDRAEALLASPAAARLMTDKAAFSLAEAVVLGVFIWSYLPQFGGLWRVWSRSDEYSAGLLVPFLAVYVLSIRRKELAGVPVRPSMWGLALFAGAQAMRYFGLFYMYASAERLSLVISIVAIVVLLFGWRMLRKVSAIIAFLLLMLPFPRSFHSTIMLPMQNMATSLAVVGLQTLGYAVVREGNIININGTYVAVAEACNGLRMVTSFFVISCLVALIINRSWWEKLVVVVSSLPIALLCNATRLIVTAAAFTAFDAESWEVVFHDFGGYAMMPLALAAIMAELWFFKKMLTVREEYQSQILVRGSNANIH